MSCSAEPADSSRLLGCIATVAAVVALLAPASRAQCDQARPFGGFPGGKTGSQVLIDASAFENAGNEMAQFWETGNPGNGTGVGPAGTCDSQGVGVGWWQQVGATADRGIRGYVAQPGCTLPGCPAVGGGLTFLVEDQTANGSGAGFIVYTADETPIEARWYDHARTDPDAAPGSSATHVMTSLPTPVIQGSSGPSPNVVAILDYADVGIGFHGVQGEGNTPLPASAVIDSYDVMLSSGGDPGRDRGLWTLVHKLPYNDAPILGDEVVVPCNGEVVAVGLTFDGGVESSLVGPASIPISCGPPPSVAGSLPPLLVAGKVGTSGEISLAWPVGCADYYAIYQGPLGGVFDTHVPLTCGTSGASEHAFTPNPQSSYYLVVPIADPVELPVPDAWEGSYGQSSFGERERSDSPCWPLQGIQECAPN